MRSGRMLSISASAPALPRQGVQRALIGEIRNHSALAALQ